MWRGGAAADFCSLDWICAAVSGLPARGPWPQGMLCALRLRWHPERQGLPGSGSELVLQLFESAAEQAKKPHVNQFICLFFWGKTGATAWKHLCPGPCVQGRRLQPGGQPFPCAACLALGFETLQ